MAVAAHSRKLRAIGGQRRAQVPAESAQPCAGPTQNNRSHFIDNGWAKNLPMPLAPAVEHDPGKDGEVVHAGEQAGLVGYFAIRDAVRSSTAVLSVMLSGTVGAMIKQNRKNSAAPPLWPHSWRLERARSISPRARTGLL